MDESLETGHIQPDNQAGLQPAATEKPKRDPEAIAKYEADYPGLVKDPVLAMLIATATKMYEEDMRMRLSLAEKSVLGGNKTDALTYMGKARMDAAVIMDKTEFITKLYHESQQIIDGKLPTSTE